MSKKSNEPQSDLSIRERKGQRWMITAVFLSAAILGLNLYVSSIEGGLESTRRDEQYYMRNELSAQNLSLKGKLLQASLDQTIMLHRLAKGKLSPTEGKFLSFNQSTYRRDIDASFRNYVVVTYLQSQDPPGGMDPNDYFRPMSNDSLQKLLPIYENQSTKYALNLKNMMNQLRGRLTWLRYVQIFFVSINMIAVIFGSLYTFKAGKPIKPEILKTI